jgi:hypothetical protein
MPRLPVRISDGQGNTYCLGAALARNTLGFASSQSKPHFRAATVAGLIVLGAIVIDLAVSTKTSGWQAGYLLVARRAAHRIAHDTRQRLLLGRFCARITTGASTTAASIGITFTENIVFIVLSPVRRLNRRGVVNAKVIRM